MHEIKLLIRRLLPCETKQSNLPNVVPTAPDIFIGKSLILFRQLGTGLPTGLALTASTVASLPDNPRPPTRRMKSETKRNNEIGVQQGLDLRDLWRISGAGGGLEYQRKNEHSFGRFKINN